MQKAVFLPLLSILVLILGVLLCILSLLVLISLGPHHIILVFLYFLLGLIGIKEGGLQIYSIG